MKLFKVITTIGLLAFAGIGGEEAQAAENPQSIKIKGFYIGMPSTEAADILNQLHKKNVHGLAPINPTYIRETKSIEIELQKNKKLVKDKPYIETSVPEVSYTSTFPKGDLESPLLDPELAKEVKGMINDSGSITEKQQDQLASKLSALLDALLKKHSITNREKIREKIAAEFKRVRKSGENPRQAMDLFGKKLREESEKKFGSLGRLSRNVAAFIEMNKANRQILSLNKRLAVLKKGANLKYSGELQSRQEMQLLRTSRNTYELKHESRSVMKVQPTGGNIALWFDTKKNLVNMFFALGTDTSADLFNDKGVDSKQFSKGLAKANNLPVIFTIPKVVYPERLPGYETTIYSYENSDLGYKILISERDLINKNRSRVSVLSGPQDRTLQVVKLKRLSFE